MKINLIKGFICISSILSASGILYPSLASETSVFYRNSEERYFIDRLNNSSWRLGKWEVNGTSVKILRREYDPEMSIDFGEFGGDVQETFFRDNLRSSQSVSVSGYGGCRGFGGGVYHLSSDHVSVVRGFITDSVACDLTSEQEVRYSNALGSANRIEISSPERLKVFYETKTEKGTLYFVRQHDCRTKG